MNFSEKKQAYHQLQGQEHLESDKELLQKKAPKSTILLSGMIDRKKSQCEILWALLDSVTIEEITENRKPVEKESHSDQTIDRMNAAREKAIKKLLEIDIETASQPVLANIARSISLETQDYKAATLRPLLKDFRDLAVITEDPEKEELSEELETENEDIKEQLEETEAELEETEAELEKEKKSEATPDPV